MTMVEPKRLTDAELNEIARRLSTPMNDDGLRVWYRQDGNAMLEEVLALRREHAQAMSIFARNPPLEGIDQTTNLTEVADRLSELWIEQQQGVWQRAEVKRIREKLADTASRLAAAERGAGELAEYLRVRGEQVEQAQAQTVDAIADGQRALEDCQRNSAERNERVIALLTKAKETLE